MIEEYEHSIETEDLNTMLLAIIRGDTYESLTIEKNTTTKRLWDEMKEEVDGLDPDMEVVIPNP